MVNKVEALQGSLVNVNIKLDRLIAAQAAAKAAPPPAPRATRAKKPKHAPPRDAEG